MNDIKTITYYFAIDELSYKKLASQSSTEIGLYHEADNAVDGKTTTCMRAIPTGISSSNICNTVWWKVDLGGLYSIYSVDIIFKDYAEYYGI